MTPISDPPGTIEGTLVCRIINGSSCNFTRDPQKGGEPFVQVKKFLTRKLKHYEYPIIKLNNRDKTVEISSEISFKEELDFEDSPSHGERVSYLLELK